MRKADWTYFIQDRTSGFVKIGRCTGSVYERLSAMRSSNPNPLDVLGAYRGDDEVRVHDLFAHHRRFREWFYPGIDLLSHIYKHAEAIGTAPADKTECCNVCRRKAVLGTGFCRSCKPRPAVA